MLFKGAIYSHNCTYYSYPMFPMFYLIFRDSSVIPFDFKAGWKEQNL